MKDWMCPSVTEWQNVIFVLALAVSHLNGTLCERNTHHLYSIVHIKILSYCEKHLS